MNRFLQILNVTIISIFFATSCKKSTDKFTPYTTAELNDVSWSSNGITDAKAKQIISLLANPTFSSTFNAVNGAVVDVNNNVQIVLPSNSYMLNGNNYNKTIASFSIKELLNKGDFIRNLASSTNSSSIQETKGAFLLNLTSDSGFSLSLTKNSSYNIRLIDSVLSQDYKFFIGSSSAINEGGISWGLADSAVGNFMQPTSILVQGVTKNAYEITSSKLSWLSIAKPIFFNTYVNSSVVLPQNFTNKTTMVFAAFSDYNVVLKLFPDYASKTYLMKDFPLGIGVKLISISYIDNQFYLGKQDIVVSKSAQYSISPALTPISVADLNSFLDGL
jgi:hypothetical protein